MFFVKVIGPLLRKYKIKGAIKAANLVLQEEVQNEIIKNSDALNEILKLSDEEKNYLNSRPKLFAAVIRSNFVSSEMKSLITTLNNINLEDEKKKNLIENYLPNVEPKLLKVLFSEESFESLKILIDRPATFKIFIENVNECYDEKALKCLLSFESRELLKFLIENQLGLNLWSGSNEGRKLLFSCDLMSELNMVKNENLKKEIVEALFSISGEVKKLSLILGEENKTLKAILGKENPSNIINALTSDTDSDSLEIFLENNGLEKCFEGKLDIVNALLKFKPSFFKKIVDNNNKLMDSILDKYEEKYIVPILEHLSSVDKDDIKVITALIDHDIFEKQNAIKIIRFVSFFKEDKLLEILSEKNKAKDFYNLNIDKFSNDVFKDGKKVVFKFIKDNNISLYNLLTFDLDAINFFFSKEFLLSEDGQINEEKKEIFIKILNNKGLAETFVKLNGGTIKFLFKEGIDFVKKVLERNNAVDIVNALSLQNINNPVALTQLLPDENNGPFFLAIMFGEYGAENEVELTVKTPSVTYDEKGNKIERKKVKFKFGKDPSLNVKELFKEMKKNFGSDEAVERIYYVATAYNEWLKKPKKKANVYNSGNNNSFNNVQNNNI